MLYVFAIAYSITIRLKIIFQYFHWVRKCIFAESLLLTQGPMKCSQTFIFVRKVIKPCAAGQKLCFFPSGSLERDFKTTNKNLVSASQSLLNTAGNYMFKVNNRNTVTRCEIYSELTIKIPERRHWHRSGTFVVNFEQLWTYFTPCSSVSIVNFEQVNAGWEDSPKLAFIVAMYIFQLMISRWIFYQTKFYVWKEKTM